MKISKSIYKKINFTIFLQIPKKIITHNVESRNLLTRKFKIIKFRNFNFNLT